MTPAERKAYDAARRPAKGRVLRPCGTYAAATRHLTADEPLCPPCADALRAYRARLTRELRARRRSGV